MNYSIPQKQSLYCIGYLWIKLWRTNGLIALMIRLQSTILAELVVRSIGTRLKTEMFLWIVVPRSSLASGLLEATEEVQEGPIEAAWAAEDTLVEEHLEGGLNGHTIATGEVGQVVTDEIHGMIGIIKAASRLMSMMRSPARVVHWMAFRWLRFWVAHSHWTWKSSRQCRTNSDF
jgi:hypothetical protein